jgi:glutamate/tyrosine decarboxylase-like PLP-dependent enzyme
MLGLDEQTRPALWQQLTGVIENYLREVETARVAPELNAMTLERLRSQVQSVDFMQPLAPSDALKFVAENLWEQQVHTPHPRYFGLFNPASTEMGIAADALVAAFNPQLAAWSHSPFANEVERHLVQSFGAKFGYEQANGAFTSGGSEANHTALLTALTAAFPEFAEHGLRAVAKQPVIYISSQGHHSFVKAARACGLGAVAVREIPAAANLQMDVQALHAQVAADTQAGLHPLLIVATAGTTNAGIIDPLRELANVAAQIGAWFHVDAAWGGGVALVPGLRALLLEGIERADSITFDAHKWMSVPMGAGLYLTRHREILSRTFGVATGYMPRDGAGLDVNDPFTHSLQWSRRFIGLKVFMSLLVAGWDGYAATLRHQIAMGERLRQGLRSTGWKVVNQTALPVLCFVERDHPAGRTVEYLEEIVRRVVVSGEAWLSLARIGNDQQSVIRACITNFRTGPAEVDALIGLLMRVRSELQLKCAGVCNA